MSDDRLRALERRWQATGEVEDEAAYLVGRVRVGQLNQAQLELAAHCQHQGALHALGAAEVPIENLRDWALAVTQFGRAPEMLIARTCAELALDDARQADVDPEQRAAGCALAEAAIAAAEAMRNDPTAEARRHCEEASASAAFAWRDTRLYEYHPFCVENYCQEALGRSNRNTGRYFGMSAFYLSLILGKQAALDELGRRLIALAIGEPHARDQSSPARGISHNGRRRIYRILCNLAGCDGAIDHAERKVLEGVRELFGIPRSEAPALQQEGIQTTKLKVGGSLREQDCLLALMVDVVAANGRLLPQELQRLERTVNSLRLSHLELHARLLRHFPEHFKR